MGCGVLVDKLNNDKRAKFSEELAEKGKDATYEENDYADKTKAGNVYCKSNAGKNGVHYLVWVEYFYLN